MIKAYALFKDMMIKSAISNEYYSYFDDFVKMINIRVHMLYVNRGFMINIGPF
jgi:hypothetical protein